VIEPGNGKRLKALEDENVKLKKVMPRGSSTKQAPLSEAAY
jgi:hypothetical protein